MLRIFAILAALLLVAAPVVAQTSGSMSSDKPASSATDGKDTDKAKLKDADTKKKEAPGSASPSTSGSPSGSTDSTTSGSGSTPGAAPATGSEKK